MRNSIITRLQGHGPLGLVALAGVFACLSLVPSLASAQGSSIGGTVGDTTGGVLPGVTVEARSPTIIEQVRTAVTDGAGQYLIVALEPGTYTVTYTLPGFSTLVREGIELNIGFTATIDVQLSVGDVAETVTVTGDSPVVDIQNVQQRAIMDREVIDTIPTGKSITSYGLLVPGMVGSSDSWGTPLTQDQGGMSAQSLQRMSIHGGNSIDQQLEINGLDVGDAYSAGLNLSYFADTNFEEMSFQYSGNSAETETGGVRINMIPKAGANAFSGSFFTTFTFPELQASNIDQDLIDRGFETPTLSDEIWTVSPNLGGPIIRDKIWFFVSQSSQRAAVVPGNTFWPVDPAAFRFAANKDDPFVDGTTAREQSINLTIQGTPNDKFKFYWTNSSVDKNGYLAGASLSANLFVSPEAGVSSEVRTNNYQVSWTRPHTNRLLFEAGVSHQKVGYAFNPAERAEVTLPGILNLGPTIAMRNMSGWLSGVTQRQSPKATQSVRGAVSFVTGSHNLKIGMTGLWLWTGVAQESDNNWMNILTFGGFPITARYYGTSIEEAEAKPNIGLYAQEQWTIDRLTVNAGLRFDYVKAGYPDEVRPTSVWVLEEFSIPGKTLVTWKDFQPRLGLAYDLSGNGKTALKFSANRYGQRDSTDWVDPANPAITNRSQSRTWNDGLTGCVDANCVPGDGFPQGDPLNPDPNGELLSPLTNPAFGQPVITTFYDPDWAFGWGNRQSNWEITGSVQHELASGVSVGRRLLPPPLRQFSSGR